MLQIAIVNLLKSWGVLPAAVVGHSSGEIAAAYASNALTVAEAVSIAYYRGRSLKAVSRQGAMAAIGLSSSETQRFLIKGVVIACENSPESTTISGDREQVENALKKLALARPDIFVRRLKVDRAYHSRESWTFITCGFSS